MFDLTGDVQNFARAAANVPGLEFITAEDIEGDETDKNPSIYLMIPDSAAFRQVIGLWNRFQAGESLPEGFTPWRDLFAQLRNVRPWGPEDRLSPEDLQVLAGEHANDKGMVRVELELVYREAAANVEGEALETLRTSGGELVSKTRIGGAKYHALLVEIPLTELQRVLNRGQEGLVASESVMHIRPQSAIHITVVESQDGGPEAAIPPPQGDPIVAIFDAVPLDGHPSLAGRLSVYDPFDLEPLAVGPRVHGTAMASALIHGDLAAPQITSLERRVFFVNVMFAPPIPDQDERFPDRLPADLFHEAVIRLKEGDDAAAPSVIVVSASLGDRNKPFSRRMSGWARVVDYLSYVYGLLFLISCGNHLDDLISEDMTTVQFEALDSEEKAKSALRASAAGIADRRILAPGESINALTVGALHLDNFPAGPLPASTFDVWRDTGLCTVSSALGPGPGNSVKPDILASGGRHHVRLLPNGPGHFLRPIGKNSSLLGGILVAAPPAPPTFNPNSTARSIGTSVATAIAAGVAARAHEALEAAYDDFMGIPDISRALLLKALLVHCARWTQARDLIIEILGPADNKLHVRQKDNVRRYLGYGAIDASIVLECTQDRATLWAVGQLQREESYTFAIPLPPELSAKARFHEVYATVAWFAPPRIGAANYRGVRLRLVDPVGSMGMFAVRGMGDQPDINQAHRGTVIHRRWAGEKAAALPTDASFELMIQRQPDEIDDPANYALVVTVAMPGIATVYTGVRDRVGVKPKVMVPG